tara:strand:- start:31 stop:147 length:117 start_codon:yes stop_codon:yes gene_type:complete
MEQLTLVVAVEVELCLLQDLMVEQVVQELLLFDININS